MMLKTEKNIEMRTNLNSWMRRMVLMVYLCFAVTSYLSIAQTKKLDKSNFPFTLEETNALITDAESQYLAMVEENKDVTMYPRTVKLDTLRLVKSRDWTSGFFPGALWYLYEYTKKETWKQHALARTAGIENQKTNTGTHDLGFMLGCSFGNGYRLTKQENYKEILLTAANSLSTRYDHQVGCIRSWDFGRWNYPVIIDNMMNLELLFLATKLTGNKKYYNIAVNHALTTRENHIRPDNSTWHVLDYNTNSGDVTSKQTHQGYSDNSVWARGQAWAIYGYTTCYRETKDPQFLETAERLALFVIQHEELTEDRIPYWDYNDPDIPNAPRDVSAAAITCSALLELSKYSTKHAETFLTFAEEQLTSLASDAYRAKRGTNHNFILMHSTGNKPGGKEIDTPLNYADYYYLEALTRYRKLINNEPIVSIKAKKKAEDSDLQISFDASETTDPENDEIVEYIWNFGDGTIDTTSTSSITYTFKSAGKHNVSVKATDIWGGTAEASVTAEVESTVFMLRPELIGKHPRILFTKEGARAKAMMAQSYMKGEYDNFLDECKTVSYPDNASILEQQQWWYFSRLAMGIAMTGDQALVNKGDQWLAKAAGESWDLESQKTVTLEHAHKLAGFALLYDCMYNYLDNDQRKKYEDILEEGLIKFRTHGYNLDDYWTNDYQNNHMHFRASASLYCAAILIDKRPELQSEADYVLEVWRRIAYVAPHDGSNHEGIGYVNYGAQMLYPAIEGLKHTTGVDITQTEHYKNVGYYYLYHVVPGLAGAFGFGDSGNGATASGPNYLFQIANNAQNEYFQYLAHGLRRKNKSAFFLNQWFIFANDPLLQEKKFTDLPLHRYFDDIGIAICRSSWESDATAVAFKCGPLGGKILNETRNTKYSHGTNYVNVAHDDPDQGTFLLFTNGKFITTGDGYEKKNKITTQHSTFIVDGLTQHGGGGNWSQPRATSKYAYPKDFFEVNDKVVFSGDMKGVYPSMQLLDRTFVSHKAKYIVIYDDARSITENRTFEWRLQTQGTLSSLGDKIYRVNNQGRTALAKILSPAEADWSTTTNKIGNILKATVPEQKENRFLVLIWPNASGLGAIEENINTQTAIGVKVGVDNLTEYTLFQKEDNSLATAGTIKFNANTLLLNKNKADNSLHSASIVRGNKLEVGSTVYFSSVQRINFGIESFSNEDAAYTMSASKTTTSPQNVEVSIGGLTPNATYFVFKKNETSGTEITADATGTYTFQADVSKEVKLKVSKKNVTTDLLEEAIANAESIYNNAKEGTAAKQYPVGSKIDFLEDIETAQNALASATNQTEVNDALTALQQAVQAFQQLENKDFSILTNLINEFNTVHAAAIEGTEPGKYEIGSKAIFKEAINDAETLAANASTPQEQIEQAVKTLIMAKAQFEGKYKPIPPNTLFSDVPYYGDYKNYIISNKTLWERKEETDGNFTVGMKTFSFTSGQFIRIKDRSFSGFELTFKAKSIKGSYGNDIMIVFGYKDSKNYSYVKLSSAKNESGVFARIDGPTRYKRKIEDNTTIGVEGYEWNDYKMTSIDSVLTLYRNGAVLFTIEKDENLYHGGEIGIGTYYRNQAYFDDVDVKAVSDYNALQAATDNATTLINEAVEGTGQGQYEAGAKAEFQLAIDSVQSILSNKIHPQNVVDAAQQYLLDAIEVFNDKLVSSSIIDYYSKKTVVYPNPVSKVLFIDVPSNVEVQELMVVSITGAKVRLQPNLTENQLDVSTLNTGVYILQLKTDKGLVRKKFMKR